MRICYVCADPGIPIFGRKGCSTHVRETILTLQKMGHEVRLVSPNLEGDDSSSRRIEATRVEPARSKKWGFDGRHLILDSRMRRVLEQTVAEWKPDAIYERYSLYSRAGGAISRRHNLPRMLEVNAFLTKEQDGRIRLPWLADRVEKSIFRNAPRVIVVSEPLRRDLMDIGVEAERIIRMPMAVDLEAFNPSVDPSEVRAKHGLDGKFVFGYVGTLGGWHGITLMYDMARELIRLGAPPFAFLIVGGDDRKLAMHRQRVKDEGLEDVLHFIGSVPFNQVPGHVVAMDVAIVPDMTYWSSPAKLYEYQACGVPALAPDFPSIRDTMDDGCEGYIFEPRNTGRMAELGLKLMREPELARGMGLGCRHRAESEHSWLRNGEEILRIFNEQIAGAGKAAS